jgi:hypothetical protein
LNFKPAQAPRQLLTPKAHAKKLRNFRLKRAGKIRDVSEKTSGSRRAEATPQVSHQMLKYFGLVAVATSGDT